MHLTAATLLATSTIKQQWRFAGQSVNMSRSNVCE